MGGLRDAPPRRSPLGSYLLSLFLGQRLRTGIESIHNFGQRSCTLFVELHMAYPQDQSDFYEDIITALLGRSRRK